MTAPRGAVVRARSLAVVDGLRCVVDFVVAAAEHERRLRAGLVGVTDVRHLHALWELPEAVPVPLRQLRTADQDAYRQLGPGFVVEEEGLAERAYRPVATVEAVTIHAVRAEAAVGRIVRIPEIYRRAVVSRSVPARAVSRAGELGVGLFRSDANGSLSVIVPPGEPIVGLPAIYRWWIGEVAYVAWRQARMAHCLSWSLGSSREEILPIGP